MKENEKDNLEVKKMGFPTGPRTCKLGKNSMKDSRERSRERKVGAMSEKMEMKCRETYRNDEIKHA